MNLRNRLKKLERAGDDSTACACFPQIRVEMYQADLSEDSDTSEPVLTGEPVPDVCADCRKPIEKRKIIIQRYRRSHIWLTKIPIRLRVELNCAAVRCISILINSL